MAEIKSGIFSSTKLGQQGFTPAKHNSSSLTGMSTLVSFEQSVNVARLINAKAVPANQSLDIGAQQSSTAAVNASGPRSETLDDPSGLPFIYQRFITSIISLFSYRLAQQYDYIPLDFHNFAIPGLSASYDERNGAELSDSILSGSLSVISLDVRLTTGGTLLVVPNSFPRRELTSESTFLDYLDNQTLSSGTEIWLAPGGKLGRYMGKEAADILAIEGDESQIDFNEPLHQVGSSPNTQINEVIREWKTNLVAWLSRQGVRAQSPRKRWSWVRVEVTIEPVENQIAISANPQTDVDNSAIILWPEWLCFTRAKSDSEVISTHSGSFVKRDEPIDLVGVQFGKQYSDPLAFSKEWYTQSEGRNREIDLRRKKRQADELSARVQADISSSATRRMSNNLLFQPLNGGDINSTGGIYPTPPDGALGQGVGEADSLNAFEASPANLHSSVDPSQGNATLRSGAETTDGNDYGNEVQSTELEESQETRAERKNSTASVFDLTSGNFSTGDGGLVFGHLDEDMFNEIGVTEADFSFFDDPDLGRDRGLADAGDIYPGRKVDTLESDLLTGVVDASLLDESQHNIEPASSLAKELETVPDTAFKYDLHDQKTGASLQNESSHSIETKVHSLSEEKNMTIKPHMLSTVNNTKQIDKVAEQIASPPLSPSLVMQKLLPLSTLGRNPDGLSSPVQIPFLDPAHSLTIEHRRESSSFNKIPFNGIVQGSRAKYDEGRFCISAPVQAPLASTQLENRTEVPGAIPRVGVPQQLARLEERKTVRGSLTSKYPSSQPNAIVSHQASSVQSQALRLNDSHVADDLDFYDSSTTTEDRPQYARSPRLKRKRLLNDDSSSGCSPVEALSIDLSNGTSNVAPTTPLSLALFEASPTQRTLEEFLGIGGKEGYGPLELSDQDFIDTAQVITDQIAFGGFASLVPYQSLTTAKAKDGLLDDILRWHSRSLVEDIAQQTFSQASQCDLESYITLEDTLPENVNGSGSLPRSHPPPRKSINAVKSETGSIASLDPSISRVPSPYVLVGRGGTCLEIMPSALPFWDTFGFGPYSGGKDVIAFCVFPMRNGLETVVDDFLEEVGNVYENCKFGRHQRGNNLAYNDGLVPIDINAPDPGGTYVDESVQAFKDTCIRLGKTGAMHKVNTANEHMAGQLMPNLDAESQNVVVYLVNPFLHPTAAVDLCFAFLALFHAYSQSPAMQNSKKVHEIVLQMIPLASIAAETCLPVLTQPQLFQLALEVYERCSLTDPETNDQFPLSRPSPSVLLAQSPPSRINFRLSSEPPQSLLQENSCLHIAYSCSVDERWISVAWSDSRGDMQTCNSFCLARRDYHTRWRPFSEVAKEVWETSVDMIRCEQASWRFMLVKAQVMEAEEIEGQLLLCCWSKLIVNN